MVNGGIINAYGANAKVGEGDWIVVEADESDGTFLRLRPTVAVVTNIDPEHLDHYGDFDAVKRAFQGFVENIPFYGFAAICIDDPDVQEMAARVENRRLITYGVQSAGRGAGAEHRHGRRGRDLRRADHGAEAAPTTVLGEITLPMAGEHNVLNALAAIAVAASSARRRRRSARAWPSSAACGGASPSPARRRGVRVVDDYGHHPVEIAAVLKAARAVTNGRVIAVVQPHRYSRLRDLFQEFCRCFNDADVVIVADVYPAGEAPIEGASRDALVEGLRRHGHRHVLALDSPAALPALVAAEAEAGDLVVCLGAGDITAWAHALPAQLERWLADAAPRWSAAIRQRTDLPRRVAAGCCSTSRWRPFTWFRVGGPADVLFLPADEDDLATFLRRAAGGSPGDRARRRLQRHRPRRRRRGRRHPPRRARLRRHPRRGRGRRGRSPAPRRSDAAVARAAAKAGIAGLEFYAGIPGTIGGALTMNAGCYGAETKDVLVRPPGASTASGERRAHSVADLGFAYRSQRRARGLDDLDRRVFQGRPDDPAAIRARMDEITARREATQPIREKTGGSTFKNPPGRRLEAGRRGRLARQAVSAAAMFSPLHANFLINTGEATAADLEGLGEAVRADVQRGPASTGMGNPPAWRAATPTKSVPCRSAPLAGHHVAVLLGGLSPEREVAGLRRRLRRRAGTAGRARSAASTPAATSPRC